MDIHDSVFPRRDTVFPSAGHYYSYLLVPASHLCVSMFSSSIPFQVFEGSCGKSVPPLSFRYSSPISMCPIMNGLSKTPNTTTFYIGIFITSLCCLEPSPPNGGQYRKPFFHRPTAVGCPIDCHRLLQLKNIYTSLSQSHL